MSNFILIAIKRFMNNEDGLTAVEYAVMLALILVACITIVTTLGGTVSGTFSKVRWPSTWSFRTARPSARWR